MRPVWEQAQIARLVKLHSIGSSDAEIAQALRLPQGAIVAMRTKLRLRINHETPYGRSLKAAAAAREGTR